MLNGFVQVWKHWVSLAENVTGATALTARVRRGKEPTSMLVSGDQHARGIAAWEGTRLTESRLAERLVLLWTVGIGLRLSLLAVPPVLPQIHHDLHLTETLVGAVTALPILLLAAVSVPGSLLIARMGARFAIIVGLLLIALAGAARGIGTSALMLFTMTFVMSVGVAICQPSLPSLVRQWFPDHVGRATALYSNGMLIGEVVPVLLTVPLLLPLVGGQWQLALMVWSLLVVIPAAGMVFRTASVERHPEAPVVRWWPNWRSTLTWRLGFILGCASISYYAANAFIPDFLRANHQGGLITPALSSLNAGQLPASFVVAAIPGRLIGRRWPLIVVGCLILISLAAFRLPAWGEITAMGVLGFCSGFVFVLSLAFPPLLTEPHDVHRLSAAMFTIAYTCSFVGSIVGGAVWDHTHLPFSAFGPIFVAGAGLIVLAWKLDLAHSVQ